MSREDKNKLLTEDLKKAALQICIFIIIYIIFYKTELIKDINLGFIKNEFIKDKIKENMIILVTGVLYYLIIQVILNIIRFVTNPVVLNIKLIDSLDGDNCTKLYHFPNRDTDMQYSVKAILEINKTNSAWNELAIRVLKNKNIEVLISVEPRNGNICCQPECITGEYSINETDFSIILTDFLISNLRERVPFRSEHCFLLEENRDKPISGNNEFPIVPKLLINGKLACLWYRLFIRFNLQLEEGYYPVKYTIYNLMR